MPVRLQWPEHHVPQITDVFFHQGLCPHKDLIVRVLVFWVMHEHSIPGNLMQQLQQNLGLELQP